MKTLEEMYKELLKKRLEKKKQQLAEVEESLNSGGMTTSEKKRYVELKAVINEIENILDMAEVMLTK